MNVPFLCYCQQQKNSVPLPQKPLGTYEPHGETRHTATRKGSNHNAGSAPLQSSTPQRSQPHTTKGNEDRKGYHSRQSGTDRHSGKATCCMARTTLGWCIRTRAVARLLTMCSPPLPPSDGRGLGDEQQKNMAALRYTSRGSHIIFIVYILLLSLLGRCQFLCRYYRSLCLGSLLARDTNKLYGEDKR